MEKSEFDKLISNTPSDMSLEDSLKWDIANRRFDNISLTLLITGVIAFVIWVVSL